MSNVPTTLCDLVAINARRWPHRASHRWKTAEGFGQRTWLDFEHQVARLSLGMEAQGLKGQRVALFADNRPEWAVIDHSLLHLGCVSIPRGSDTSPKEQKFIFLHSDAQCVVLEGVENLLALASEFEGTDRLPETVILIDTPKPGSLDSLAPLWRPLVNTLDQIGIDGEGCLRKDPQGLARLRAAVRPSDTASVIYTSGTSGNPKGVVLSHANFLHNVLAITPLLHIDPLAEECTVSVLPIWHVYERAFEFCSTYGGMTLFYSSIRSLGEDLLREKPTIVASVPRVWESIYGKLQAKLETESTAKRALFRFFVAVARSRYRSTLALKNWVPSLRREALGWWKMPFHALAWTLLFPLDLVAQKALGKLRALLGGRMRASFSGGGSLPPTIDIFFNMIGITLVNAYGMTESSPGSITRRIERNVPASIGIPLEGVQVRILRDDGAEAAKGEKGLIHVRGPNVMAGYYKNPEATAAVLDSEGWLNTGDLGALSFSGDYVITGRAKSTIVLVGGENVEPEPIEEKLQESDLIEHAVVVGQDQKGLRAILTVKDDQLKRLTKQLRVSWDELWHGDEETLEHSKVLGAFGLEIKRLISRETGFKPFEAITKFVVLKKKFQIGHELTQTLKVKRRFVEEKYGRFLTETRGLPHKAPLVK